MVHRRPAQCQLQLPRPAPGHGRGQQGRADLGGRARRTRASRAKNARLPTSSFITRSAGLPMSSSATASRRATASSSTCRWCPRRPSPCSPAPASARCTRWCSAVSARNPSPTASRIRRPSWSSRPTAASGAARWCRSSRMWTRRSRSRIPRANCWLGPLRRSSCCAARNNERAVSGGPRPLVA